MLLLLLSMDLPHLTMYQLFASISLEHCLIVDDCFEYRLHVVVVVVVDVVFVIYA